MSSRARCEGSAVESEVIEIVAQALGVPADSLDAASSSGTVEAWDSLGHLAVLEALDRRFDGITSKAPELGNAESIAEIVEVVQRHA